MRRMTIASAAVFALVGGLMIAGPATVSAHGDAEGVVKERMEGMKAMKTAMKTAGPMVSGAMSYDAAEVKKAAETIAAHTGETLVKLFPEGSGGEPSEAKNDIWSDWDKFVALAQNAKTKADALAMASADQAAAGPAFEAVGQTCKECHRPFKD